MSARPNHFAVPGGKDMLTPVWAVPPGALESAVDAAFSAGSCLNALDRIVRSEAPWLGAWRYRLAVMASEASLQVTARTAMNMQTRDAWYLRKNGEDVGPAGRMLFAWRRLCERTNPPDGQGLRALTQTMGLVWSESLENFADEIAGLFASTRPSLSDHLLAALKLSYDSAPASMPLAFWMADLLLAWRMRWPQALPVLSLRLASVELKYPTFSPDEDNASQRMFCALGWGAVDACRVADSMNRRAGILASTLPSIRTKGATDLADALLADDAVRGFTACRGVSRFAVRRFMDRLEEAGAVSELTGRGAFRLYGL